MSTYFLIITLLPIFPTYWGYVKRNGTEHYKTMMATLSLMVMWSIFLGYVLFNEYAPGFIFSGNTVYQAIAYDGD